MRLVLQTTDVRCGSEDHLIAKCPKPPKYNEKKQKQVSFNEKGDRACNNGKNNSDQKIYTYMAHMSGNDECPSGGEPLDGEWLAPPQKVHFLWTSFPLSIF